MAERILLVGCGKMGSAMLAGWIARGTPPADILVVEPHAPPGLPAGVKAVGGADAMPADFVPDTVILAVKPQMMDQVVPAYARFAAKACFVSIAAGTTIAKIERLLGGAKPAVIRCMPNTPAAIGQGITVGCANAAVSAARREAAARLLEAVGQVEWVERESQIDAVTAVSGSGPAYVFLLAECMAAAGAALGLEPGLAARLANATVSGAGALMKQSGTPPDELRRNVTSPNGTTQAALEVLMAPDGLAPLMQKALAAAERRSRELAG